MYQAHVFCGFSSVVSAISIFMLFSIQNISAEYRPSLRGKSECKGRAKALLKCYSKSPINLSNNICNDLCNKEAVCSKESGACVCLREPTPTSIGGHFTHCTNWNYVDQSECKGMCQMEAKNDSRVCWTFVVGNYCTCF